MAYEPKKPADPTLGDPVHRDPVTGEPARREAVNIRPAHEEKSSGGIGKWLAILAVVALGAWLLSGLFDTGEEVEVATNTAAPVVVTEEPAAAPDAPVVAPVEAEAAPDAVVAPSTEAPVVTDEAEVAPAEGVAPTVETPVVTDEVEAAPAAPIVTDEAVEDTNVQTTTVPITRDE